MISLQLGIAPHEAKRILCLGAHSDDIEIGCGGTMLMLLSKSENVIVQWVVFGATGQRADEARKSASAFLETAAQREVKVMGYRDGYFPFVGDRIKDEFEAIKEEFSPDIVFTHYRGDRHQDHRLVCDLTWNTFRNHLIFEYEIPKYDGDIGQPNLFVSLPGEVCDRKIKNLLENFASQRQKHWFDDETFRAVLRLRGMESNSPSRYAEAFYCRKALLGP